MLAPGFMNSVYVDIYFNRFPNTIFFYLFLDKRITEMYISQNLNYYYFYYFTIIIIIIIFYIPDSKFF